MNYKIIRHILGWVLRIEGITMLLPLLCAFIYKEYNCISTFIICIIICIGAGVALSIKRPKKHSMYAREGFVTVGLSWILLSLFGALPFTVSGSIPHYVDAIFETVSGFSTTGASILTDVEALPKSMIFWRSLTHWIGGMGVLVFLVALLPLSGSNNMYLIRAESPGPTVGKLVPKIKTTAKILYLIYIALTLIQIVLLLAGGMSWFDALTHAFGTAGTGGFGIKNSSVADYSPYLQNVITIFMIIFGVDFSMYHLLLMKKPKLILKSDEFKGYIGIITASIILISINCNGMYDSVATTVRHAAFQVGSVITTTGFSTTDFDKWPEFSKTILVILMFIGACAGSTGGGIKVSRVIVLLKSIVKEIRICAHPKNTLKITMNGRVVEHETMRAINVFIMAYVSIFTLSLFLISIDNFDFTTNFTAVAAAINNIGPGLGKVGPTGNFSEYSFLSKIILTFDMLVGRLEIFPLLIIFSPYTWKK
ncbi:MAG: TrkH family potassium uptake protein [Clostridia bacterium]|nr:TrkH family potassium uptake protein [Clostridia bacterium]